MKWLKFVKPPLQAFPNLHVHVFEDFLISGVARMEQALLRVSLADLFLIDWYYYIESFF